MIAAAALLTTAQRPPPRPSRASVGSQAGSPGARARASYGSVGELPGVLRAAAAAASGISPSSSSDANHPSSGNLDSPGGGGDAAKSEDDDASPGDDKDLERVGTSAEQAPARRLRWTPGDLEAVAAAATRESSERILSRAIHCLTLMIHTARKVPGRQGASNEKPWGSSRVPHPKMQQTTAAEEAAEDDSGQGAEDELSEADGTREAFVRLVRTPPLLVDSEGDPAGGGDSVGGGSGACAVAYVPVAGASALVRGSEGGSLIELVRALASVDGPSQRACAWTVEALRHLDGEIAACLEALDEAESAAARAAKQAEEEAAARQVAAAAAAAAASSPMSPSAPPGGGEGGGEGGGDGGSGGGAGELTRLERKRRAQQRAMAQLAKQSATFVESLDADEASSLGKTAKAVSAGGAASRVHGGGGEDEEGGGGGGGGPRPSTLATDDDEATAAAAERLQQQHTQREQEQERLSALESLESPPMCIICHTEDSQPLGFVCCAQPSATLLDARPPQLGGRPGQRSLSAKVRRAASHPHQALSFCGHAIHLECFAHYNGALRERAESEDHFEGKSAIHVELGEFLCPLCKRLSNALVPHLAPTRGEMLLAARLVGRDAPETDQIFDDADEAGRAAGQLAGRATGAAGGRSRWRWRW